MKFKIRNGSKANNVIKKRYNGTDPNSSDRLPKTAINTSIAFIVRITQFLSISICN